MTKYFPLFLLAVVGCKQAGESALDGAELCGQQECPVGTAFAEYRSVREGFELDVGLDPKTYSGDVAYKNFGEGECAYTCETIAPCPDPTFPVISATCFTCAVLDADGEIEQGSCDDTSTEGTDTAL